MLTFIKIGGSLITDKTVEKSYKADIAQRLAKEIQQARTQDPTTRLLIGHGSGSFGHYAAKRYGTINGVHTPSEWTGFAEVATVAAELSSRITQDFATAGIPIWRLQPSASVLCRDGTITHMATTPIQTALENNIVPLVHGDVAVDEVRGGTIISTETIFTYLAHHLPVQRIVLLGEVAGVYDQDGNVIIEITPTNLQEITAALGGSRGTDVTGGMVSKVTDMVRLVQEINGLNIHIIDGSQPHLLFDVLTGQKIAGTSIHAT